MKKTIGIVGAGSIGKALATHLLNSGYSVTISNSKSPESLKAIVSQLGAGAKAVTTAENLKADIVVLALPWLQVQTLTHLANWNNKIVIDTTNHFITSDFQLADLGGRSSSEVVLDHLPGARLVKAFNSLSSRTLAENPNFEYGNRVILISGDDNEATVQVSEMITDIGFAPVDMGSLAVGSKLQEPKGSLCSLNLIKLK